MHRAGKEALGAIGGRWRGRLCPKLYAGEEAGGDRKSGCCNSRDDDEKIRQSGSFTQSTVADKRYRISRQPRSARSRLHEGIATL